MSSKAPLQPNHSLAAVQSAAERGRVIPVPPSILQDALDLGFDEQDVRDCLCALTPRDFYKPDSCRYPNRPFIGAPLDIYKVTFQGRRCYIKFYYNEKTDLVLLTSIKPK